VVKLLDNTKALFSVMTRIIKYINKIANNNGLLSLLLNPFHFARRELFTSISTYSLEFYGNILDVGCGVKPYEKLFKNCSKYTGLELDTKVNREKTQADYYYNGEKLPFTDNSFEGIICNQVLEHVFEPDLLLTEFNRVLKSGGKLLLTVPFIWDEHEQPFDYARYTQYGISYILKKNGFTIIKQSKTGANAGIIFQIINAYLYKQIKINNHLIKILSSLIIYMPVNVMGLVASLILPNNEDLYLDNIVFAKKT